MEQDVLLLENKTPEQPEGDPPEVVLDEEPQPPNMLPRLFWVAVGAVALNVLVALIMYVTATPGKPLPAVSQNDPDLFDGVDFSQGPKTSPVGDGSDAGPRARLTPMPVPKLRPEVEATVSAQTMPPSTIPDLPRSSVLQMPRQSAAPMPRQSSPMGMPRSTTPEMPRATEPAMPKHSTPSKAQAAAEAAAQATVGTSGTQSNKTATPPSQP